MDFKKLSTLLGKLSKIEGASDIVSSIQELADTSDYSSLSQKLSEIESITGFKTADMSTFKSSFSQLTSEASEANKSIASLNDRVEELTKKWNTAEEEKRSIKEAADKKEAERVAKEKTENAISTIAKQLSSLGDSQALKEAKYLYHAEKCVSYDDSDNLVLSLDGKTYTGDEIGQHLLSTTYKDYQRGNSGKSTQKTENNSPVNDNQPQTYEDAWAAASAAGMRKA